MSNSVTLGSAAILISILIGCGGEKYPGDKRFPLTGSASYNGQPIDLGSLSLTPAGGDAKSVSGGVIQEGKYEIPEAKGPNAGTYRVELHWLKLTGKQLLDNTTGEMYDERVEGLPAKFQQKSELTIEVPTPDNTYNFELKSP